MCENTQVIYHVYHSKLNDKTDRPKHRWSISLYLIHRIGFSQSLLAATVKGKWEGFLLHIYRCVHGVSISHRPTFSFQIISIGIR